MLEACALSDIGCVRANNEDYSRIFPELGLYVLADGMGGAKAGERASRLAVETVSESILQAENRDSQALLVAVEEANRRVLEAAANDPELEGMGTTLVAALEVGDELSIASVGDSRAYLFDRNGFRAITEDQSWVNEVGRPLGLNEEALRTHPMRHVLTMAIGAGVALEINYYHDIRLAARRHGADVQRWVAWRSRGRAHHSDSARRRPGPAAGRKVPRVDRSRARRRRSGQYYGSAAAGGVGSVETRSGAVRRQIGLHMKAFLARALVVAFPCMAMAQIAVLQIKVLEGEGVVHPAGARIAQPLDGGSDGRDRTAGGWRGSQFPASARRPQRSILKRIAHRSGAHRRVRPRLHSFRATEPVRRAVSDPDYGGEGAGPRGRGFHFSTSARTTTGRGGFGQAGSRRQSAGSAAQARRSPARSRPRRRKGRRDPARSRLPPPRWGPASHKKWFMLAAIVAAGAGVAFLGVSRAAASKPRQSPASVVSIGTPAVTVGNHEPAGWPIPVLGGGGVRLGAGDAVDDTGRRGHSRRAGYHFSPVALDSVADVRVPIDEYGFQSVYLTDLALAGTTSQTPPYAPNFSVACPLSPDLCGASSLQQLPILINPSGRLISRCNSSPFNWGLPAPS